MDGCWSILGLSFWKAVMAKADLKAADELLNDATTKLHDVISCYAVSKQSVSVTTMMLDVMKWLNTNYLQ